MKSETTNLLKFIKDTNGHLLIPHFQRDYSWEKEQCSQLLNDIISIGKNTDNSKFHFLGSLIYFNPNPTALQEDLTIIDGQQRLITIIIFILGLYKFSKNNFSKDNTNHDAINLEHYNLLKESWRCLLNNDDTIKLVPKKEDREAFTNVFDQVFDPNFDVNNINLNNKIQQTYQLFADTIGNNVSDFISIIIGLNRLVIVTIQITNNEDPQIIFENVNSKGLKLSTYDMIKSSLLIIDDEQEEPTQQEEPMQQAEEPMQQEEEPTQQEEETQVTAPPEAEASTNNYIDLMDIVPKSVTNCKPIDLMIDTGTKIRHDKVETWTDVFHSVVSLCFYQNPSAVKNSLNIDLLTYRDLSFCINNSNVDQPYDGLYYYRRLDERYYVRVGYSAGRTISILQKLINNSRKLKNTHYYISFIKK